MMNIEERKRLQDKLILLNRKELEEVDRHIDEMIAARRKFADIVRGSV